MMRIIYWCVCIQNTTHIIRYNYSNKHTMTDYTKKHMLDTHNRCLPLAQTTDGLLHSTHFMNDIA
jgi:hypothetical protein